MDQITELSHKQTVLKSHIQRCHGLLKLEKCPLRKKPYRFRSGHSQPFAT